MFYSHQTKKALAGTPEAENDHIDLNSVHEPLIQDMNQMVGKVINSSRTYYLKNNSKRSYKIKIYTGIPKVHMPDNANLLTEWESCLAVDANQATTPNITPTGTTSVLQQLASQTNTALDLYNPNQWEITPYITTNLTARWKISETVVILEPGQEYTHYVQGPKNVMFEPIKMATKCSCFTRFWCSCYYWCSKYSSS